jgi:uncharacterized membrane protein YhaH (DUF805 family)
MICPYCRGGVRDGAEKCWHCGADLTGNPLSGAAGAPAAPDGAGPQVPGAADEPEPVITMLAEKDKRRFVVVEGYTDSDPLDFDHLKYLLFSPGGRINRRRYLIGSILNSMLMFVCGMAAFFISQTLMLLVMLLFVYPGLMLMIKRCHDRDRSGHFVWVLAIPFVSLWPAIELAFVRGTRGVNRFGPDPL